MCRCYSASSDGMDSLTICSGVVNQFTVMVTPKSYRWVPPTMRICTVLVAISKTKLLAMSDASAETRTSVMDKALQEDSSESYFKLTWKPSRNGGRTIATPTATSAALAASRRQGNRAASSRDFLTDVSIQGEIGREDGEVMKLLMTHLTQATGLALAETDYSRAPKVDEIYHLASKDSMAPPRPSLFIFTRPGRGAQSLCCAA